MARGRSYAIIWSPEADTDLLDIWDYLDRVATRAIADRKARDIRKACGRLARLPLSGRSRDNILPGFRSIIVDPYVVFYRLRDRHVEIVRVLHGRRDFDAIFGEDDSR